MDYKPFTNPKIIGHFPLNVNLEFDGALEFFDYDSFADLNNPELLCLWSHDEKLQIASVKNKSFHVFLGGGSLNIEVLPEPENEVSRVVFETKMRQEKFIGISPGFRRIEDKCKSDADGSRHLIVNLSELSLTTNPVHRGSRATLNHDLDMGQLKKQVAFEEKWLNEMRGSYSARIKKQVADFRAELAAMRNLVNDSERIAWSAERVAQFKQSNPFFQRVQSRGGYQTAHFSTRV